MTETISTTLSALLGGGAYPGCESPSLRLDKYVRLFGQNDGAQKKQELAAVCSCRPSHPAHEPAFDALPGAVHLVAKLLGRLIVNQAGGIRENAGLCLHPHSGSPFLPGSAVKGIARHAAWCEWNEATDEEAKARLADDISRIFGEMSDSGLVAFLPAFPIDSAPLATDIVNSHHPAYYSGRQSVATDDESPIPVYFPVVEAGPRFLFTLAPLRGCGSSDLALAREWLRTALSRHGAGAKTAAGYGWFDADESLTGQWRKSRADELAAAQLTARKEAFSKALEAAKALPESGVTRQMIDELAKGLDAIGDESFRNDNIAALNALRKRLPPENPLDKLRTQWETMPEKARLGEIKGFPRERNEERKKNIVLLLRESSGVGHDLWAVVRSGQKGDIARGVDAIRQYCVQTLKLPKMP